MKRIYDLKVVGNKFWECTLSDWEIIVAKESEGKIVEYPLWDIDIYKGKYWNKNIVKGSWREESLSDVFKKVTPWVYEWDFILEWGHKNSRYSQELDKLRLIDRETWAYYSIEMNWVSNMMRSLFEGKARLTKNGIKWEVYFRIAGSTLFMEFITKEFLDEVEDLYIKKNKKLDIVKGNKLKLWHKYKKKSSKMEEDEYVTIPYFCTYLWYCRDEKLVNWMQLIDSISTSSYNISKSWEYYDEEKLSDSDIDKVKKQMVMYNNRKIKSEKDSKWKTYDEKNIYGFRDLDWTLLK